MTDELMDKMYMYARFVDCNTDINAEIKFFRGEHAVTCTGKLKNCPLRRVNNKSEVVCLRYMDLTDEMIEEFISEAQTCSFLQYVKRLRK